MNNSQDYCLTLHKSLNLFDTIFAMGTMRPMRCFVGPHRFVYVLRHASWLSKTPHFGGCAPRWGYDSQIRTRPRFLCNCIYPMFPRSEVIVLTYKQTHKHTHKLINKQTPPKTSNVLRYATTLGKSPLSQHTTHWYRQTTWHLKASEFFASRSEKW